MILIDNFNGQLPIEEPCILPRLENKSAIGNWKWAMSSLL